MNTSAMGPFVGLVLAAGASRRMGSSTNKLIEIVRGKPLVSWPVEAMRSVLGDDVLVVLGHDSDRVLEVLGPGITSTRHSAWEEGMGSSIAHGVGVILGQRASARPRGILVCVGDLPGLEASVVEALVAAFPPEAPTDRICIPTTASGREGHPVLFGSDHFDALCALRGDRGARGIVDGARDALVSVAVDSDGILRDVDTPSDLADWRT